MPGTTSKPVVRGTISNCLPLRKRPPTPGAISNCLPLHQPPPTPGGAIHHSKQRLTLGRINSNNSQSPIPGPLSNHPQVLLGTINKRSNRQPIPGTINKRSNRQPIPGPLNKRNNQQLIPGPLSNQLPPGEDRHHPLQ